jgi:hypothetical protein
MSPSSDDVEDRSLFLEAASWVDDNGNEAVIDGPGLLLTKDSEIESVMFLAREPETAIAPNLSPS